MLSSDIFGDVEPSTIRYKKPQFKNYKQKPNLPHKNLKRIIKTSERTNLFDSKLIIGNIVNHQRFGNGEVVKIEGKGADLKAEIKFSSVGVKKLLLRFAKLEVIA